MNIDAAQFRRVQDRFRKDKAVRNDDGDVRAEISEVFLFLAREPVRAPYRDLQIACRDLNRAWPRLFSPAGRTRRAAVNSKDFVAMRRQARERRDRKLRSSHENYAH